MLLSDAWLFLQLLLPWMNIAFIVFCLLLQLLSWLNQCTSAIAKSCHCFDSNISTVFYEWSLPANCCFFSKKFCHHCQLIVDSVVSLTKRHWFVVTMSITAAAGCASAGAWARSAIVVTVAITNNCAGVITKTTYFLQLLPKPPHFLQPSSLLEGCSFYCLLTEIYSLVFAVTADCHIGLCHYQNHYCFYNIMTVIWLLLTW